MTAVEWLFHKYKLNDEQIFADDYNQALEMDKQQMATNSSQLEISDEEIEKAAEEWEEYRQGAGKQSFEKGAKWYREQLKQRK